MMTNSEIRSHAWASTKGQLGVAFLVFLIYLVVAVASSMIPFGSIFVSGPLAIGMAIFYLKLTTGQDPEVKDVFEGFNNFLQAFVAYFLYTLAVTIGILLLIIPGIIWGFAFSQVFFIMAKDPNIKAIDALKKSKAMMDGHKMNLFLLVLSFIPWVLLGFISLGIGFIWIAPFIYSAQAKFFLEISGEGEFEAVVSGEDAPLDLQETV